MSFDNASIGMEKDEALALLHAHVKTDSLRGHCIATAAVMKGLAEELMEETFFLLMTKKPKFKGKSSFKTWLYAIGRNVAVDSLRRNKKLSDLPVSDYENLEDEENAVELAYLKEERKIQLHKKQIF